MELAAIIGGVLGGIILLGGAVKAAPAVWQFVKAAGRAPIVLERLYVEFSPNGGGTMRDAMDRLETSVARLEARFTDLDGSNVKILAWQDEHAEEDIQRLREVAEETARLAAAYKQTDDYLHVRMHDLLNRITPLIGWASINDKRLQAIEGILHSRTEALRAAGIEVPDVPAPTSGPPLPSLEQFTADPRGDG